MNTTEPRRSDGSNRPIRRYAIALLVVVAIVVLALLAIIWIQANILGWVFCFPGCSASGK